MKPVTILRGVLGTDRRPVVIDIDADDAAEVMIGPELGRYHSHTLIYQFNQNRALARTFGPVPTLINPAFQVRAARSGEQTILVHEISGDRSAAQTVRVNGEGLRIERWTGEIPQAERHSVEAPAGWKIVAVSRSLRRSPSSESSSKRLCLVRSKQWPTIHALYDSDLNRLSRPFTAQRAWLGDLNGDRQPELLRSPVPSVRHPLFDKRSEMKD